MNDIPVLHVRGTTLADGYEKAIYETFKQGCEMATQYDKPGDPLSKDCTLNLVVEDPEADPMIHKAFPGGISDLREYTMEIHGAKDEWVKNINDPEDTRWEYTYHGRFARYGGWKENQSVQTNPDYFIAKSVWIGRKINQIDYVVEKLSKQPYTRQAQMITWMPSLDLDCYDPPCLQSVWLRAMNTLDDKNWVLNTNIRFRSNDAWGASYMNMFGLMRLIRTIADRLEEKNNCKVKLGRLNWQADSYHIYGKDLKECKARLIDKIDAGQPFENRVYNFRDVEIQEMYNECVPMILEKIKETENGFNKI